MMFNRRGAKPFSAEQQGAEMARKRYWMASAAVLAAVAAVPLAKANQAPVQQGKAEVSVSAAQPASEPQSLTRDGRPVRVVYGVPSTAR